MSELDHRITSFRLEVDIIERLHRLAGKQQADTGRRVVVSDIVRQALRDYLRKHEQ